MAIVIPKRRFGVRVDDLRMDIRDALRTARDMGYSTVEIGARSGAVAPDQLTRSGRRDLVRHVASLGLELGALGAAPPGRGYGDPRTGSQALDLTLRIMELAADVGAAVVTTTVEAPPDDDAGAAGRIREALTFFAAQADRTGRALAIMERGGSPEWLLSAVRAVGFPNLGICLDTGETLARGVDPGDAAAQAAGAIKWVHLRDAIAGSADRPGREAAPGEGSLDLAALIAALDGVGYGGPLIAVRGAGTNPKDDFRRAIAVWQGLV